MIGGPQGSGIDSSATLFGRSCAHAGLWIYGKREYHSNIIGDHSYFQVRVSDQPVNSHIEPVHLLATYENRTAQDHAHEVAPEGAIIYDPAHTHIENLKLNPKVTPIPIRYDDLVVELSKELGQDVRKLVIMKNVMAVAASFALVKFDISHLETALRSIFTGRKAKLVEPNMAAARKAYQAIPREIIEKFPFRLEAQSGTPNRMMLTGTTATALGKLKAGCRFQTYYPITPASDESVYLEAKSDYGITVVQTEDEIAAITMAVGAGITGVRSATSTSGPGLSLMAEGMGWAGMNEVPVVIFNYQRGGPATGLPTRNEQGDLLFAINAAHGEFPRLLIAPGDLEEYFEDAFHAFNYAERYHTPVIVMCDKQVANNTQTILPFDESKLTIHRGPLATDQDISNFSADGQGYKRFRITEDGVSPRPLPGTKGGTYWMTGDEHDELGHICEVSDNRTKMHAKRMRKLELPLKEIPVDRQWRLFGDKKADHTLVSWGCCKGAILDAMPVLAKKGIHVNFLQIRLLWPFPEEGVARILKEAKNVMGVEQNYSGQLCRLIRQATGFKIEHKILKWNGRPVSETEVVDGVTEIAKKKTEQVVLNGGV